MRTRKIKGGVLFKTTRQHIIPELKRFSNGESEYVANGKYGVVLKLSASESTVLRNATCAIKNLLVKIVAIDTPQEIQGHAIKNITVAAFEEEVHIHQDVCERSLEKFHCSIAPTILYADIFTLPELEKLFPSIHKYIGREGRIGLIFMEMIEAKPDSPAFTVYDYYVNPRNRPYVFAEFIPRARRLLIMLAQIGFLHNDFHLGNFLCQETPLVYIIDFGRATRISPEQVALFNSYVDASDLSKIVPFLFGTKISFMENPKYVRYQWVHKNSLEPYVRGRARTIAVTSQKYVVDPIRLKEEEMALCYLPPKLSYSDVGGSKSMKGGVLLYPKTDIMPELQRFENGRIKFLKQGTFGLLLKLTTKEPTLLKKLTPKQPIKPCDSILVKIVAIDDTAYLKKSNGDLTPMEFVSLDQFEKEVHIHQEVVQQSIDIFECSITPILLYAEVYTKAELMERFKNIGGFVKTKGKIGLIFMENVIDDGETNTYTLADYERIDARFVYSMFPYTRRMLIMLGQLGILHNDYHLDNFLYSDHALYIIDFGLATRMTAEELDKFNGYVEKKDITNVIQFLFGTLEPHMTSYTDFTLQYQWIRRNQISRYVPGIEAVPIADETTIIDPIRLTQEHLPLCFIPEKINYVERESESIKESIKEQIRNGSIVLDQTIHDKELILEFVKVNGKSLEYASPELQADKEVVLHAVRQNGLALQYTPLKDDKEVVLHAVRENGFALQYTPLDDMEVIMAAVSQNYLAFQLVSPKLRADKEFVKRVLFLDGRCYPDIDDRLKDDPEMMAYARYSQIPFLFRFNPGAQEKINDFFEWTPVKGKPKSDTFKLIMKRHRENYPPPPLSLGGKTRKFSKRIV